MGQHHLHLQFGDWILSTKLDLQAQPSMAWHRHVNLNAVHQDMTQVPEDLPLETITFLIHERAKKMRLEKDPEYELFLVWIDRLLEVRA